MGGQTDRRADRQTDIYHELKMFFAILRMHLNRAFCWLNRILCIGNGGILSVLVMEVFYLSDWRYIKIHLCHLHITVRIGTKRGSNS